MNSQKPNLFSFATSELSQDAFICWLASWAKPELKTLDPLLHKTAQEFIISLILNGRREYEAAQIETVDVQRQDDRIDVIIFVNRYLKNRLAILIEDKTHTNHHSGQLDRYYSLLQEEKYGFRKEEIVPIFFKTGYQSFFDIGIYHLYSRNDFLSVLNQGKVNGVQNSIYDDFLEHLTEMENAIHQYKTKPLGDWSPTDWIGFYLDLYPLITKSKEVNWSYVANPAGGFYGFWWHFTDVESRYKAYLQLEQKRLCFKVAVNSEADGKSVRTEALEKLKATADRLDYNVKQTPSRLGKWMTILRYNGTGPSGKDYRVFEDGQFSMAKTLANLKKAEQVLTQAFRN
ncbi:PD-(D/E)XK nuclease family protein [Larkinella sp. VNQ87]|uniref:PD-(D/E)XK nuclease family protein n=1 Tax=Larkinella sp. VNQ87 TaxID=3400921 RepID=UPI003C0954FD